MRNHSNWPDGINRASCNFTGRTPRTSNWGGAWAPDSRHIPKAAWIWAVVVISAFIAVAFIGSAAGM